jgi:hypothetical protein
MTPTQYTEDRVRLAALLWAGNRNDSFRPWCVGLVDGPVGLLPRKASRTPSRRLLRWVQHVIPGSVAREGGCQQLVWVGPVRWRGCVSGIVAEVDAGYWCGTLCGGQWTLEVTMRGRAEQFRYAVTRATLRVLS